MAAIRLYTDEHVAWAVVKGLRERGVDVVTVEEAGLRGGTDEVQLAHALAEGRVVVSHDTDFLRLHAAGVEHSGVVFGAQDLSVGEVIFGLMLIVQVLDADEMVNHVEFI